MTTPQPTPESPSAPPSAPETSHETLQLLALRAQAWLAPLIDGWAYLPVTNWSAGPGFYAHVCNEVIVNRRKVIVEMGAGISTVLLARLLRRNGLDAHIWSVDQDAEWQKVVAGILKADAVRDKVTFLQADVLPAPADDAPPWYDENALRALRSTDPVDLLLVDGPRVTDNACTRYGAVPFLLDRLAARSCVFLHDVDRPGEQAVLSVWRSQMPDFALYVQDRHAWLQRGEAFESLPQTDI